MGLWVEGEVWEHQSLHPGSIQTRTLPEWHHTKYRLVKGYVSENTISNCQHIPADRLEHLRKYGYDKVRGEKAKEYEEHQQELLKDLKSYDAGEYGEDDKDGIASVEKGNLTSVDPGLVKAAIWVSFGINVILTIAKLMILIISGSVSVMASFLDSCLDLLSGSIIFIASLFQKVQPHEVHTYPVGMSVFFKIILTFSKGRVGLRH